MNTYTTHCPIADSVSTHANVWDMPEVTPDESTREIVAELLEHGCVTINRTEYHVMELYQWGGEKTEEDLRNLVFMNIRDPEEAKELATEIITECAIYFFGVHDPGLASIYYQENHGEY